jgi:hypothetical protein
MTINGISTSSFLTSVPSSYSTLTISNLSTMTINGISTSSFLTSLPTSYTGLTISNLSTMTINGTSPNLFLTTTPTSLTVGNLLATNSTVTNLVANNLTASGITLSTISGNSVIKNSGSAGLYLENSSGIGAGGSWIELYPPSNNSGSMVLGASSIGFRDTGNSTYAVGQRNNFTMTYDGANGIGIYLKDTNHGIIYEPSSDALLIQGYGSGALKTTSNGNRALSWYDSGYIGIATSAPVCQLDVTNSVNADVRLNLQNKNSGSNAFTYLSLNNDHSGLVLYLNSSTRTAGGGSDNATIRNDSGSLILQSKGQATTMTFDTNGNTNLVGAGLLSGTNAQFSYLAVKDTTGSLSGAKYYFDVQGGNTLNLNANSYSTVGSSLVKTTFTPSGGANFLGGVTAGNLTVGSGVSPFRSIHTVHQAFSGGSSGINNVSVSYGVSYTTIANKLIIIPTAGMQSTSALCFIVSVQQKGASGCSLNVSSVSGGGWTDAWFIELVIFEQY